ncbi:tyrosine-type recombinase/integrase [Microbulbifer sp. MCCC 1A16149]|uniref:tyrosine-type recombinase/integrase n=1 Tax=Microbulbifer sp. MCCC 1A16149 TaxID=3411322 RepID=UPI003D0CD094
MAQKPSRKFPYILKRGGGYTFRYIFPTHVQTALPHLPKELRRTLRTDSYSEAVCLVSGVIPIIQQIKRCRERQALHQLCTALTEVGFYTTTQVNRSSTTTSISQTTPIASTTPLLSKAWEDFTQWKSWKPKAASAFENMFADLLFFLGDRFVDTISKKDIKDTLHKISLLPKRNFKKYRDKPIQQLSKLNTPIEERISGKTVKGYLALCQSLFSTYLVNEVELLSISPTDGIKWKYENQRYACMSDTEIRDTLKAAESKPEWFKWFFRIAAYSGARRSEIASLTNEDFKIDSDSGRHYFVISEGKTKAATRCVPVHPELIAYGLLDWVSSRADQLFPIPALHPFRATDIFRRMVKNKENDIGERITLHSVRHTFITKARSAGIADTLIQQVVGHEKKGAGITDRYTHTFPISSVATVVDAIKYD